MAEIVFLKDENGKQQVVDLIYQVANAGESNSDYAQLSALIAQVLAYLKEVGVPPKDKRVMYGKRLDDYPITLTNIVKELENHPPLLEARANWRAIGAFRAIFFCDYDASGQQHLYFTKAVIKESTYDESFERAIQLSEEMIKEFLKPE